MRRRLSVAHLKETNMDPDSSLETPATGQFILDLERLQAIAERNRQDYSRADPFPHIVLDDLFSEDAIERVRQEVPRPDEIRWIEFDDARGKKLASKAETQLGAATRNFLYQMNSSVFIEFLETLTGIEGLIPDPHFWDGGLHQIVRGGFLKIHADFNRHPKLKLDRRLNLLVYLNRDWREEWGGHLELWDRKMTECRAKILPIFGRCVIFNTTDFSYHGHPDPLGCPNSESRKSVAVYYYSNGRPHDEIGGDHYATLFRKRPGEKRFLNTALLAQNLLHPIVMSMVSSLKQRLER